MFHPLPDSQITPVANSEFSLAAANIVILFESTNILKFFYKNLEIKKFFLIFVL